MYLLRLIADLKAFVAPELASFCGLLASLEEGASLFQRLDGHDEEKVEAKVGRRRAEIARERVREREAEGR